MDDVRNTGAVVTGGASGIGLATARLLGHSGARVVLADVEASVLESAVAGLRADGIEAHGVEAFLPRMIEQGEGGHLLFTASFAGLVPNVGLGPYCVAKYGVVALAEVLARELREHRIGVSVLCPMRVGTNIGDSERNRSTEYGGPDASPPIPAQDAGNDDLAGRILAVEDVARQTVEAIKANRLYVLPHEESRTSIRRRFERIDRTFDE